MTKRTIPDDAILIPENATCVFKGMIFDVYQWPQQMFDGTIETFEMLRRPDSVFIIAIDDDGSLITQDEEQPSGVIRRAHCPAGRVDVEDFSVLDAAKRELEEETGFRMANWRLFEVAQPERKIEWFIHTFVAWGVKEVVPTRHDAGEKIVVGRSNLIDVIENIAQYAPSIRDISSVEELKHL